MRIPIQSVVFSSFLALGLAIPTGGAEPAVSVVSAEAWHTRFGGEPTSFRFTVTASAPWRGTAHWRFSSSGRTLARGEQDVTASAIAPATVDVRLTLPDVNRGVTLRAELEMSLAAPASGATALARALVPVWIFHPEPFADRQEQFKKMRIRLFDPEQKTADIFAAAGLPFSPLHNPEALVDLKDGVLVIGEGVSFREFRSLREALFRVAAAGVPVLCLAPAGGDLELPGLGGAHDLPPPRELRLRRHDVIRDLDKRLDASAWPPDGQTLASSFAVVGERGGVLVEARTPGTDGDGWPWIELDYPGRGRLIVCGFAIIGKWQCGPTPRFLLARILEELAGDTSD